MQAICMPAYSVSPTSIVMSCSMADACNIPSRQTEKLEVCNRDYRKYCHGVEICPGNEINK